MPLHARRIGTPLGEMVLAVDEADAVVALEFGAHEDLDRVLAAVALPDEAVEWGEERGAAVVAQLEEYFRGERREFELALAPRGSEFQRRVWSELTRIPYGSTISYGELARRVGKSSAGASRAVGQANAANPIAIVVPCHRVVGHDGRLTGYAAGISRKAKLLTLEGALAPDDVIPPHAAGLAGIVHAPGAPGGISAAASGHGPRTGARRLRERRASSPDQVELFSQP